MTLYHVTTEDALKTIMIEGLKPMIGPNSEKVGEEEKFLYLSNRKDVGKWKIILDRKVVLMITGIAEEDVEEYGYSISKEYLTKKEIPASQLKRINIKTTKEDMRQLCYSYINTISGLCSRFAQTYANHGVDEDAADYFNISLNGTVDVLERLNFSMLEKEEIKTYLKECGEDAEITLCDTYYSSTKRLWEMLAEYDDAATHDARIRLFNWITKNLTGCLYVNTGGL